MRSLLAGALAFYQEGVATENVNSKRKSNSGHNERMVFVCCFCRCCCRLLSIFKFVVSFVYSVRVCFAEAAEVSVVASTSSLNHPSLMWLYIGFYQLVFIALYCC